MRKGFASVLKLQTPRLPGPVIPFSEFMKNKENISILNKFVSNQKKKNCSPSSPSSCFGSSNLQNYFVGVSYPSESEERMKSETKSSAFGTSGGSIPLLAAFVNPESRQVYLLGLKKYYHSQNEVVDDDNDVPAADGDREPKVSRLEVEKEDGEKNVVGFNMDQYFTEKLLEAWDWRGALLRLPSAVVGRPSMSNNMEETNTFRWINGIADGIPEVYIDIFNAPPRKVRTRRTFVDTTTDAANNFLSLSPTASQSSESDDKKEVHDVVIMEERRGLHASDGVLRNEKTVRGGEKESVARVRCTNSHMLTAVLPAIRAAAAEIGISCVMTSSTSTSTAMVGGNEHRQKNFIADATNQNENEEQQQEVETEETKKGNSSTTTSSSQLSSGETDSIFSFQENGCRFHDILSFHLPSRMLRGILKERCAGKNVLDICPPVSSSSLLKAIGGGEYASTSIAALLGGAKQITTIVSLNDVKEGEDDDDDIMSSTKKYDQSGKNPSSLSTMISNSIYQSAKSNLGSVLQQEDEKKKIIKGDEGEKKDDISSFLSRCLKVHTSYQVIQNLLSREYDVVICYYCPRIVFYPTSTSSSSESWRETKNRNPPSYQDQNQQHQVPTHYIAKVLSSAAKNSTFIIWYNDNTASSSSSFDGKRRAPDHHERKRGHSQSKVEDSRPNTKKTKINFDSEKQQVEDEEVEEEPLTRVDTTLTKATILPYHLSSASSSSASEGLPQEEDKRQHFLRYQFQQEFRRRFFQEVARSRRDVRVIQHLTDGADFPVPPSYLRSMMKMGFQAYVCHVM